MMPRFVFVRFRPPMSKFIVRASRFTRGQRNDKIVSFRRPV